MTLTTAENSPAVAAQAPGLPCQAMPVRGLTAIALVAAMAFVGQAQAADPVFHGSVSILTKAQKEEMRGKSWHKGCPAPPRATSAW